MGSTHPGRTPPRLILPFLLGLAGAGTAWAQGGLPGGATLLNETHRDWTVACVAPEDVVRCVMSQTQVGGENRQRVLAIELSPAEGGGAAGMLVLPFGLRLDDGARLAIDGDDAPPPSRFSTCLPAGCLVPLAFDAATLDALKAGTALAVTVTANDSGQDVAFSISLTGFTSALDRVVQLNGS